MVKFTVRCHTLAMFVFQLFLNWGVSQISQEIKTHLAFMAAKLSGIVKSLKFHLWIVRRNVLVLNDDGVPRKEVQWIFLNFIFAHIFILRKFSFIQMMPL